VTAYHFRLVPDQPNALQDATHKIQSVRQYDINLKHVTVYVWRVLMQGMQH